MICKLNPVSYTHLDVYKRQHTHKHKHVNGEHIYITMCECCISINLSDQQEKSKYLKVWRKVSKQIEVLKYSYMFL